MLSELCQFPEYQIAQAHKESLLLTELNALTQSHVRNCPGYAQIVNSLWPDSLGARSLADLPYLPIRLFKTHPLRSVEDKDIFKTLMSSGTTGQQPSLIYLDRETARRQTMALARIMSTILGQNRLPMILVEPAARLADRSRFTARSAGVLGMMNFGRDHFFCLDENMNVDKEGLSNFLKAHAGGPFLIFGFTFMVWQYFFLPCSTMNVDLSNGILIHSGGWKKLQQIAVSNGEFKRRFAQATGLSRCYNFYGTVEQVGSVFLEGEDGYFYAPNFADVIIRDPATWKEAPVGTPGVIQILSVLPSSYPGHSLLTEDLGILHGVDDGSCGRRGKYFSVLGRIPSAELRGCSDTHAAVAA